MRNPFRDNAAARGTSVLREIISMSKTGEVLHHVPERLASIIDRYDHLNVDPHFRHDIYNILSSSIDIAEALVDPTFPIEHATEQVARQMEVLTRVLRHLNKRPSRTGYSILAPQNKVLYGQFSTVEEAESQLAGMQAIGGPSYALVVPIKITSQHVVQPQAQPIPAKQSPIADGALPQGIIPNQPAPQPTVPLSGDMDDYPETDLEDKITKAMQDGKLQAKAAS